MRSVSVRRVVSAPDEGVGGAGLERRVRAGALWSALNSLGIKVGNIAIMVVVVRLVTPTEFGVFAASLTIAMILGSFADWGVSAFLIRSGSDLDEVAPTVAFIAIVSGVVLAAGTAICAPFLAGIFSSPDAEGPIRVMALCLVIGSFGSVPSAILAREFRQDRIFVANVIAFVPSNVVLVLLAMEGSGAMAFAWSRVVSVAFQVVAVTWVVGRWFRPLFDRAQARRVLRFGLPLAGANLVSYTLLNGDFILIGNKLGPELLGIYVLAFNAASWSTSMLAAAINGVAMPAFSRVGDEPTALRDALHRSTRVVSLLALPVAAMTLALAEPLVLTLYGQTWSTAVPVLQVLGLYGAMFVIVSLLSNLLVGIGCTSRVLLIQLLWLAALVPSMLVGLRWFGVSGVAWAHVVVLVAVVLPVYLFAVSRLTPHVIRTVAGAVVPVLMACTVAAVSGRWAAGLWDGALLQLMCGGIVGGVVYLALASPMLKDLIPSRTGPVSSDDVAEQGLVGEGS